MTNQRSTLPGLTRTLILSGAAVAGLLTAGCNIVGPAVYFIHGPEKVKPQFVLPPERSTVVFVDDRGSVLPTRATRQRIAKATEQTLLAGKTKSEIISSDALLPIATQERFGKPTGIAQIGESVGAEVVVYAKVDSFGLSPDGAQFAPVATAQVKVVDAKTRKRLWPVDDKGEWVPVEAAVPTATSGIPRSHSERAVAENHLAELLGRNIARIFVEYEAEDVAKRVGGDGGT
ncbi:MAG: hypothetical protein IT438_08740 [Phycisphaerales bacterium]|nr:hypothetical protein [Phycisphaerales bacterium]